MGELQNKMNKSNIKPVMKSYGFSSFEEIFDLLKQRNIDVQKTIKDIQPIAFENSIYAFALGCAIAIKKNEKSAEKIALSIGEGLQAFCTLGSVSDLRKIGIGHGELANRLLSEKTSCFCFLAGHESFAAAEGAIGIANNANKVRKKPLRVILNGLGKDAAYIIARINGFTYVHTNYIPETNELQILKKQSFGTENQSIKVYGCYNVDEGVAVMKHEKVDVSITGNSTNPVRFQHPVAGIYKMYCIQNKLPYFSVASGGGTGRTLHPDNVGAGPASYGITDTMGKMHCDAQFAGSSSVPAHVDMMGFIGMGNNPIVGATVSLAVQVALQK